MSSYYIIATQVWYGCICSVISTKINKFKILIRFVGFTLFFVPFSSSSSYFHKKKIWTNSWQDKDNTLIQCMKINGLLFRTKTHYPMAKYIMIENRVSTLWHCWLLASLWFLFIRNSMIECAIFSSEWHNVSPWATAIAKKEKENFKIFIWTSDSGWLGIWD